MAKMEPIEVTIRVRGEVQIVPETWSDERMHEMSRDCWCVPLAVEESDGLIAVTHRREVQESER